MQIKYETINSIEDNHPIYLKKYIVENAKASIQLIHGMQEYQERYTSFSEALANAGYNVYSSDLRGHGKSIINNDDLGFFGHPNGLKNLLSDQVQISELILSENKEKSIYLFSHSFGTIIARNLLKTSDSLYDKVVFSGAPNYQALACSGIFIGKIIRLFRGKKSRSKFLANLSTGSFNKAVTNPTQKNEWLSVNEENVKNYNKDPLCGFTWTTNGYIDLFRAMSQLGKTKDYNVTDKNLPILFIAGEKDPCTGGKKGLESSFSLLKKAGYGNLNKIVYKGMRHEILNEDCKDTVTKNVIDFYNK